MQPDITDEQHQTMTLEAFADTIVPGEKRFPGDVAVAGAASGGGAVAAGALALLADPATGIANDLGAFADLLNEHARKYIAEHGLSTDPALPPLVGLSFAHRTTLIQQLTGPDHPEKEFWILVALFSNMAFDTGAHLHTADAMAAGHPGLAAMGFARPGPDGLWRFPDYSYGRPLANLHPATTASGSPS